MTSVRYLVLLLTALALSAPPLVAQAPNSQTLPPGLSGAGGGSASAWPFNTTNDQRWQWVFDTSLFTLQAPMSVLEISIRLATAGSSTTGGAFSSVVVTLASSPNDYLANPAPPAGQDPVFANNLGPDATVVRAGPWLTGAVSASPGTTGTWIPLGISPGFVYDPTLGQDLVIQVDKCGTLATLGAAMDMITAPPTTLGANRYGHTSDCAATTRNNFANEAVLVLRLEYAPLSMTWQVDQPGANLSFDGGTGTGLGPVLATRAVGVPLPIAFGGNLVGQPFDVAIGTRPGVPLGAGGLPTPGGQIINLDLGDPTLTFVFGLGFTLPFVPISSTFAIASPGILSAQLLVLDPGLADGLALSALNTLVVTP